MNLPSTKKAMPLVLIGLFAGVVSAFVALFISSPTATVGFTVAPDRMEVGNVTSEYVEVSGQECFEVESVRTLSSEAWRFEDGSDTRPEGFQPFYRAPDLTVEFGTDVDAIPLNDNGCFVFTDFQQPVPPGLQEDLEEHCDESINMHVELIIEAFDKSGVAQSEVVFWRSEAFQFEPTC